MLLRELGFLLVLFLATAAYLLYRHCNKKDAAKNRKYFVAVALLAGALVAVLDALYAVSKGHEKLSFMAYLIFAMVSYAIYRVILLAPKKNAPYFESCSIGLLASFLLLGACHSFDQYKEITTAPFCPPERACSDTTLTQEHETEMHRVFNLPLINYCLDRKTGEQKERF